jgi:hypothetical protein
MPALPGELMLTGKQAATILEKVADDPETRDCDEIIVNPEVPVLF